MGKNKNKGGGGYKAHAHHVSPKHPAIGAKSSSKGGGSSSSSSSSRSSSSGAGDSANKKKGMSALQQKFAKKLEGSRFRIINERLYTSTGEEAYQNFQSDPNLFDVYHEGFREQASHWPHNPLDGIIAWIKGTHAKAVVADMGCGDARLAREVCNKVYSFDLVSTNSLVTACDIAHVPIPDASVDIVVFCLSLMGTNIGDFLREALRILKKGGILKIAEVRSRFEGESEGIKKFIRVLKKAGFDIAHDQGGGETGGGGRGGGDAHNKMFFEIEGKKSARSGVIDADYSAKACIYKKR